jgi:hypothetical protein
MDGRTLPEAPDGDGMIQPLGYMDDEYETRCPDCGEYADGEVYCYGCGYIRHCEERAEALQDRGWRRGP